MSVHICLMKKQLSNKMKNIVAVFSDKEKMSFGTIDELKDYCCSKYDVQHYQVKVEQNGNVGLYNKTGESFAFPCKIIN